MFDDDFDAFTNWFAHVYQVPVPFSRADARRLRRVFAGREPVSTEMPSVLDAGREALVDVSQADPYQRAGLANTPGAPLLRRDNHGQVRIFGVSSTAWYDVEVWDEGNNDPIGPAWVDFKTFAPETLRFLHAARTYEDPCLAATDERSCEAGYKLRVCEPGVRSVEVDNCRAVMGNINAQCAITDTGPRCVEP
jgi:hypothetical protein